MNSQTTPLLGDDDDCIITTTNSCIICLEEDDTEKVIIEPKDMNFLIKKCPCQFYIHEKCFNLWYFNKPVCPICTEPISYEEPVLYFQTNYKNGEYVYLPPTPDSTSCVRRTLVSVVFVLVILFMIGFFCPIIIYYK
jgi:hypothetical protein